ncbi:RING-type E3 ubiquitin transferase [Ranunculus cassubicifolius]
MNNTITSAGILTDRINGAAYFIGISIGIIFLISIVSLASVLCKRAITTPRLSRDRSIVILNNPSIVVDIGLDDTTIQSYPTIVYSVAKLENTGNNTSSCCSICLSDYKDTDILRRLPECGHLFHVKCVDPWLRLHPTCPVCRHSPMATPLSTPLAEVVPLSYHQV